VEQVVIILVLVNKNSSGGK